MSVTTCNDMSSLSASLTAAGGKLVLIDFYAVWCGPCRMIAPKVAEMAQEFPDVVFLKVDVDANPEAAEKYEIAAMPTFVFMKDSNIVGNVVGASETKIREMINTHK